MSYIGNAAEFICVALRQKKLALIIFNYDEKRGKGKCRHFPCVGEFTTLR